MGPAICQIEARGGKRHGCRCCRCLRDCLSHLYLRLRITFLPRARKGLGISSFSGSHTAGGSRSEDFIGPGPELRESLEHRFTSSMGRPPALACASSTRVLPPMLRCITALNISSPPLFALEGACFAPVLRVGEPASAARFADDGILDKRRCGDLDFGSPWRESVWPVPDA